MTSAAMWLALTPVVKAVLVAVVLGLLVAALHDVWAAWLDRRSDRRRGL